MSAAAITQLVLTYRYWILIPLSLIEGPIIAFLAGTLAAVGIFDIYVLAAIFFVRDVGLDAVYYAIGYFGGRTAFAERMLAKVGVRSGHLEELRTLWSKRPFMTLFVGKLAYGIASAFIVVAGMARMPLGLFFRYGIIVAVFEYGGLLLVGYFLGASLGGDVIKFFENMQYVIAAAAVVFVIYYITSRRARQELLEEDRTVGESGRT